VPTTGRPTIKALNCFTDGDERNSSRYGTGEDGKGAKVVGRFVRFTDSDQLTALTSKLPDLGLIMGTMPVPQGQLDSMVLEVALPGEGMKVGLEVKKHPLFGRLVSPFQ